MPTSNATPRVNRGVAARQSANGKPKTIKVRDLKLTIPEAIPVGTFRAAFKDESSNEDVVQFLNDVLGEEQMELFWALDLKLADGPIPDQVNALLEELASKVQTAIGLEAGE